MSARKSDPDQIDRFRALAKELETDRDEGRWEGELRKILSRKPKDKPTDQPD